MDKTQGKGVKGGGKDIITCKRSRTCKARSWPSSFPVGFHEEEDDDTPRAAKEKNVTYHTREDNGRWPQVGVSE